MPHRYSNFVFDLDGTILSSPTFYIAILETIFARNGLALTESDTQRAIGLSPRPFFEEMLPAEAIDDAMRHLVEQSKLDFALIPMFDGMGTLIEALKIRGAKLAVWTSRDKASATALLNKHGVLHHFEQLISANCVAKHKPDPEGLHLIARSFACTPSDIVMIGDHDVDMQAAKTVGAFGLRANWHGFTPSLSCPLASQTIHSVASLHSAILV